MDYDIAAGQRRRLNQALKRHLPASTKLRIPTCDDGKPCFDGRCPMCGSDLDALLKTFLRGSEASARRWSRAAFILDDETLSIGDTSPFPFARTRAALAEISSTLQAPNSAFIGTFGLIVDAAEKGNRKVAAIEFCCTEILDIEKITLDLASRFNGSVKPLALHPGHMPLRWGDVVLLAEGLLYGYLNRDTCKPALSEGIWKKKLLAELAQNYGKHLIADRLITHGLALKNHKICFAPGSSWPIAINSFRGLSAAADGGAHVE
ncbi:hypothetical protein [Rhizobium sp. NXC14]|uniref:hypothetical protein n=1 Tax=Rhizobium sp. NXC14 TaxID=1981173 RepID=UPI000A26844F|nr:hypothetical protein [Rhizobium sp. NXC14]